jgi:pilus assembly protein Flp/PilA
MFNRFLQEENGQTLVEYGLLISLLALVAVVAMALFGSRVRGMYGNGADRYPDPVTS